MHFYNCQFADSNIVVKHNDWVQLSGVVPTDFPCVSEAIKRRLGIVSMFRAPIREAPLIMGV